MIGPPEPLDLYLPLVVFLHLNYAPCLAGGSLSVRRRLFAGPGKVQTQLVGDDDAEVVVGSPARESRTSDQQHTVIMRQAVCTFGQHGTHGRQAAEVPVGVHVFPAQQGNAAEDLVRGLVRSGFGHLHALLPIAQDGVEQSVGCAIALEQGDIHPCLLDSEGGVRQSSE